MGPGSAWWLKEALDHEGDVPAAPPLIGAQTADVVVVGAGYTGLWTALMLKQRSPGLDVCLLESSLVGSGPSGRNGGFLHGYWEQMPGLAQNLGGDTALRIAEAGSVAQQGIVDFIEASGDDVWLRQSGIVMTATSSAQEATVDRVIASAKEVGATHSLSALTKEDVQARCDSPTFRRGVLFHEAATLQPARLARALRKAVLNAGVRLYEGTTVEDVQADATLHVRTGLGSLSCRDVVLATNSALARTQVGRPYVTNLSSYVVLTEPVPDLVEALRWTGGEGLRDARMFLHYFRTTPDGRIVFGTGAGPIAFAGRDGQSLHDSGTVHKLTSEFRRLFPAMSHVAFTHAWAGPIDMASDHLPFFGTKPGTRIHYACGFSGHGVNAAWIAGKTLTSLVMGERDKWTDLPFCRRQIPKLPPEPIRFIGGKGIKSAIMGVEDALDAGTAPPLWARLGAELPKRLGLRIGTRR
jgi:glycine/D-amino acid oxidase-like deaminating enzyme